MVVYCYRLISLSWMIQSPNIAITDRRPWTYKLGMIYILFWKQRISSQIPK